MSKRPGDGWEPSLTLPPLPGTGVVGVVVSPGPTSIPGEPSLEPSFEPADVSDDEATTVAWAVPIPTATGTWRCATAEAGWLAPRTTTTPRAAQPISNRRWRAKRS
jgi:hypothetical protein